MCDVSRVLGGLGSRFEFRLTGRGGLFPEGERTQVEYEVMVVWINTGYTERGWTL